VTNLVFHHHKKSFYSFVFPILRSFSVCTVRITPLSSFCVFVQNNFAWQLLPPTRGQQWNLNLRFTLRMTFQTFLLLYLKPKSKKFSKSKCRWDLTHKTNNLHNAQTHSLNKKYTFIKFPYNFTTLKMCEGKKIIIKYLSFSN